MAGGDYNAEVKAGQVFARHVIVKQAQRSESLARLFLVPVQIQKPQDSVRFFRGFGRRMDFCA